MLLKVGKNWFGVVILLFLVYVPKAKAIVIHPKEPFEGIEKFIDSLETEFLYQSNDSKLKAAFALWSLHNHANLFGKQVDQHSAIDSSVVHKFIVAELGTLNDEHLKYEWRLLKLRKKLENNPAFKSDFNSKVLSEELLAAYYIVSAGELSLFDINGFRHLKKFKECYKIAAANKNLAAFEFLCLRNFGMAQFHKNNIDSSVYYFSKIIPVCERLNAWSFKYIPGYGVFYREKQTKGRMHMNLGMSIEKTGNIVKAIDEYEQGEREFNTIVYPPGIWWGKSQIINSYLDLGEFDKANELLVELIASIKEYFGTVSIDNEFMWIALHEYDYFDLYQTRSFLDSVLNKIELEGGPVPFKRRLATRDPLEYSYQQRYVTVLLALRYMINEEPITNQIFSVIDSLKSNYLKDPLIEYATKRYIYNSMEFNEAAWKVALDSKNNKKLRQNLLSFIAKPDSIYNFNGHFKTILILFHSLKKYEIEEQIISAFLPKVEIGNNVVAQRKLYYQYADVLKHLGQYKKALVFFQKSDSLRQQLNSLNHLEQLNNFDRELEIEKAKSEKAYLEKENEALENRRKRQNLILIGLAIGLALIGALIIVNRNREQAKKKRLIAEKELLRSELQNEAEKVRLASVEILKGNQSFNQLITDVENLKGDLSSDNRKKILGLLIEHKYKSQDEIWQQFNLQFQSHYQGFYKQLAAKFPSLTQNEKRLCAMHISGLSNHEVNAITGQKLSSIHTMKSKIRKKIGAENDEELKDQLFLLV